jgi:hypothetical protein
MSSVHHSGNEALVEAQDCTARYDAVSGCNLEEQICAASNTMYTASNTTYTASNTTYTASNTTYTASNTMQSVGAKGTVVLFPGPMICSVNSAVGFDDGQFTFGSCKDSVSYCYL